MRSGFWCFQSQDETVRHWSEKNCHHMLIAEQFGKIRNWHYRTLLATANFRFFPAWFTNKIAGLSLVVSAYYDHQMMIKSWPKVLLSSRQRSSDGIWRRQSSLLKTQISSSVSIGIFVEFGIVVVSKAVDSYVELRCGPRIPKAHVSPEVFPTTHPLVEWTTLFSFRTYWNTYSYGVDACTKLGR